MNNTCAIVLVYTCGSHSNTDHHFLALFADIEWHNLAFITTRDLELEEYVLHYDWYTTRFNETAKELLAFLHLQIHEKGELTPFFADKSYPYFLEEEKRAVRKAFEIMASPLTWKHVQHYFDNIEESTLHDEEGEAASVEATLERPTLDTLVKNNSLTEISGDVQWLMDFAIVGYPKVATSNLMRVS